MKLHDHHGNRKAWYTAVIAIAAVVAYLLVYSLVPDNRAEGAEPATHAASASPRPGPVTGVRCPDDDSCLSSSFCRGLVGVSRLEAHGADLAELT